MNHRLINYFIGIYLIFYVVLWADDSESSWLIAAFILAMLAASSALLLNVFSTDGAFSALISGTTAMGLGHWFGGALLLLFVIGSYGLTALLHPGDSGAMERRTGSQVWCNGFWFILGILLWSFTGQAYWLVGSAGAIAVAAADTTATITGTRHASNPVISIYNFKKVPVGTDGGISFTGTTSALAAALIMALTASLLLPDIHWKAVLPVGIAGFSGCILDSYLGAIFQKEDNSRTATRHSINLNNDLVNATATGFGMVLAIVLYHVI